MTYELSVALIKGALPPLECPEHGPYEPQFQRHDGPKGWAIRFRPCCWKAAFDLYLAVQEAYAKVPERIPAKLVAVRLKMRNPEGTPMDLSSPKMVKLLSALAEAMAGNKCPKPGHDAQAFLRIDYDEDGDATVFIDDACCPVYEKALKFAVQTYLTENHPVGANSQAPT